MYKEIVRPLLFKMDPEKAHWLAGRVLNATGKLFKVDARAPQAYRCDTLNQPQNRHLANRVGLAAGFDKNGHLVGVLGALGFGFAEIGSITARPSKGNPKPRMFRLPEDEALINRMGLNGEGAEAVCERLMDYERWSLPLGLNIAKTNDPNIQGDWAIDDILKSLRRAIDIHQLMYISVNISCPNTKEGAATEYKYVHDLVVEIARLRQSKLSNTPVLLKLSPDSEPEFLKQVIRVANGYGLNGFICGNTTNKRWLSGYGNLRSAKDEVGGLSGKPLFSQTMEAVKLIDQNRRYDQVLIACGGIRTGSDADYAIKQGADLIQLYTALVYEGPNVVRNIVRGMK